MTRAALLIGVAYLAMTAHSNSLNAQDDAMPDQDVRASHSVSRASHSVSTDKYVSLVTGYRRRVPLWRLLRAAEGRRRHADDGIARARLRGLLPQLTLGGRLRQGNDFLQVQTDDTGRLNLSSDEQLTVEIQLRFELDRLVYDASEPVLRRAAESRRKRRRERRLRMINLYYEWLELCAERDLRGSVSMSHHGRINRVAAQLNLFTDGVFFRMLRRPQPQADD